MSEVIKRLQIKLTTGGGSAQVDVTSVINPITEWSQQDARIVIHGIQRCFEINQLCETCRFWNQNSAIRVDAKCPCTYITDGAPDEQTASGRRGDVILTAPKFGCVNHEPKPS